MDNNKVIKLNNKSQYDAWNRTHESEKIKIVKSKISKDGKRSRVQAIVKPDACGEWQKEKPNKPCYFIHRYNRKDNNPSLFEAVMDGGVLVVANIQDDEFVETMEDFADGDFFIIEKY